MLTEEIVKQFEAARAAYWKERGDWMDKYDEIQEREACRCVEFARDHGLSLNDSIEQQIADWRWKQTH